MFTELSITATFCTVYSTRIASRAVQYVQLTCTYVEYLHKEANAIPILKVVFPFLNCEFALEISAI